MGLHAVVYRNVPNGSASIRNEGVVIDSRTGQVSSSDDRPDPPGTTFVAEQKRLGNVAEVGFLREAIGKRLGSDSSILIEKVLYSASHCGDQISVDEFAKVRSEVAKLQRENNSALAAFLSDMEALLTAAEREHNPIVFE